MELSGSSVDIATGYGVDDGKGGVRVRVGSRIFTSLYRPDMLCGPPDLISVCYGGSCAGGKAAGA
jgi:hypothetical protein